MRNVELTFKEFIIAALHRRGMILCIAIATAVLLGAFSAYTTRHGISAQQEEYKIQLDAYQQSLASKRTSKADTEAVAAQARSYNANSLLMRVNPYAKQVANVSFTITLAPDVYSVGLPDGMTLNLVELQIEAMRAIVSRYLLLADKADLSEVLGSVLADKVEDSYLRELISISMYSDTMSGSDTSNPGIIVINATGSQGLDAQSAAHAVFIYLQEQKPLVEESAIPHDIHVLNDNVLVVSDNELANYQNTQRTLQAENDARVIQLQKEINDLQAHQPKAPSLLFSIAQSAALGFLLGLVLGIGLVILTYLIRLPIHYATQIQRQLGPRFLAGSQNPGRGIIARWKARLAGEGMLTDPDAAAALAAVRIEDAAGGAGRVVVIGSLPESNLRALCEKMNKHLAPQGLTAAAAAGITTNAQAATQLRGAVAVVLAERMHTSRMRDALAVKERAEASGKPVLGYVLV